MSKNNGINTAITRRRTRRLSSTSVSRMGRRNSRKSESSTEICTKMAIIINPIYIAITLPGIGTDMRPPMTNSRKTQEPTRIIRHIVKSDSLFMVFFPPLYRCRPYGAEVKNLFFHSCLLFSGSIICLCWHCFHYRASKCA